MSADCDSITRDILDFMAVIYECHTNTNFSEDRAVFTQDLVVAMGWVVNIKHESNIENIVEVILSRDTEKYFGDYWRQGVWGDKEATALKKLKESVKRNCP